MQDDSPTLNDMWKAIGAHSFLSTKSIFGTWASRISRGPDADWILCKACEEEVT